MTDDEEIDGQMMKFYADCMVCLAGTALRRTAAVADETQKAEYMRRVCAIMQAVDLETDTAPEVDARLIALRRDMLGVEDDFTQIKHQMNALMLSVYDDLKARVEASPEPVYTAMQLAIAANYVDYNVLKTVDPAELMRLLNEAADRALDRTEYARFMQDLAAPGELVYLHDNCGEIAVDRLMIETIQKRFPHKKIVSIVRSGPVINDATMEDAQEVGLTAVCEVIGNGTYDIAGTKLTRMPADVRARVENAGVVISKGQGNFETLAGCGLNVYYLLLSKCESYTRWYGFEHFGGILRNDRRLGF